MRNIQDDFYQNRARALQNADKLLRARVQLLGENSLETARLVSMLGRFQRSMGDYRAAVDSFQRVPARC